jgi:hypothetical protein
MTHCGSHDFFLSLGISIYTYLKNNLLLDPHVPLMFAPQVTANYVQTNKHLLFRIIYPVHVYLALLNSRYVGSLHVTILRHNHIVQPKNS